MILKRTNQSSIHDIDKFAKIVGIINRRIHLTTHQQKKATGEKYYE